jgi:hypothetical protein
VRAIREDPSERQSNERERQYDHDQCDSSDNEYFHVPDIVTFT